MERRSIREGGLPFAMTHKRRSESHQEDSEDEFYDCNETEEEGLFQLHFAFKSYFITTINFTQNLLRKIL